MRIKILLLFICTNFLVLFCYGDEELEQLWALISDINSPTLEDYQAIENYLANGKRPYLDPLKESLQTMGDLQAGCLARLKLLRSLKLTGYNNEMPIFEKYKLKTKAFTSDRCIVLYSSYNAIYPSKAEKLLVELRECGYTGDVLFRIGGFPNVANEGLKISHVPYAFKVAFLREAQLCGYKNILWLDTAIHPLTDLEEIFAIIEEKGYFFTYVGMLSDNQYYHLPTAADALGITREWYPYIHQISSSIIGLNMENEKARHLLDNWYAETERVQPNINWFPEELSLSVAAWRKGCSPYCWFGALVCSEGELDRLQNRPSVKFYLDALR